MRIINAGKFGIINQDFADDVSMEVEIGEMVKNTLRHKMYVRLLQKKYQQIELAMSVR